MNKAILHIIPCRVLNLGPLQSQLNTLTNAPANFCPQKCFQIILVSLNVVVVVVNVRLGRVVISYGMDDFDCRPNMNREWDRIHEKFKFL